MNSIYLKISDIKDIKKIGLRHILQSIIIFTCFCTLDTVEIDDSIWLFSVAATVVAICCIMLFAGKIRMGAMSNILNIVSSALCVACFFCEFMFIPAMFFVTLSAGIRLLYARSLLNDYSMLIFVLISVFTGIVLRVVLVMLPVWTLSIFMLTTIFNPTLQCDSANDSVSNHSENQIIPKPMTVLTPIALALFFLSIEIFGGPLTDKVSHSFPLQLNIAYLIGYLLFIGIVVTLRIKFTSVVVLMLAVLGLFFFLIPITTNFGIYFLLFLGGGIKVLMLALPIAFFKGRKKYYGALSGVFLYRLVFLASGTTKALAGDSWHIESVLTYTLAGISIVLSVVLIVVLIWWDRMELKDKLAKESIMVKEVIKEIPIIRKPLPNDLSDQERRVAELVLKGKSYREIADEMLVAMGTVSKYAARVFIKAGVGGQKQFIAMYTISEGNYD